MNIVAVELGMLRVPLKTPFKTALRVVEQVEDVVVLIHTDEGVSGHGSAPATAVITGDTHASIIDAIRHHIAPVLIGRNVLELNRLTALVENAILHNASAKAAVEMALYDLWGQHFQAPLYRLLGGNDPNLTTDITISIDTPEKMAADASDAIARGYRSLKIKIGRTLSRDLERLRAVHRAVGGGATLRLDANQGWTPQQAIDMVRRLDEAGIEAELLEQPVPAHDLYGMEQVTRESRIPVMADESVFSPQDAIEVIRWHAADILNIKLMKTGGVSGALRLADIARVQGVPCMMGCMLESSIGILAAAHVAASRPHTITRVDLDPPSLCRHDPVDSASVFDGPRIVLGGSPGLGIRAVHGIAPLSY